MRWGIRRFQNRDGTLTAEGEKRYGKSDSQTSGKKKTTYRLRLEEKYRKTMSPKEAEQKADKLIRTQKIIAATAAVTVAAAAAYIAGRKALKNYVDKTLKAGTQFHTVANNANKDMKNRFFAAYKPIDRMKYRGMYGGSQLGGLRGEKIYDITTKATKDIKIASNKTAEGVFSKLYKNDSEFRKAVEKNVRAPIDIFGLHTTPAQQKLRNSFYANLDNPTSKKSIKSAFKLFNLSLAGEQQAPRAANQFYSELKKKGFGAIYDLNDLHYSGYKANSPIVVFDTAAVVKDKVEELSKKGMHADLIGSDIVTTGAEMAVLALGTAGYVQGVKNEAWELKQQRKKAAETRKQNTKYSWHK